MLRSCVGDVWLMFKVMCEWCVWRDWFSQKEFQDPSVDKGNRLHCSELKLHLKCAFESPFFYLFFRHGCTKYMLLDDYLIHICMHVLLTIHICTNLCIIFSYLIYTYCIIKYTFYTYIYLIIYSLLLLYDWLVFI